MIHIVYKTTNILNNKYYIGVHSTFNINDNYLGCGHWRGRKLTEDHKRKMSNNRKGKDCGKCSGRIYVWNSLENRLTRLHREDVDTGLENGSIKKQCQIINKFRKVHFIKIG